MQDRAQYSIQALKLLGGISRNTIYHLLRTGQLTSVSSQRRRAVASSCKVFHRSRACNTRLCTYSRYAMIARRLSV